MKSTFIGRVVGILTICIVIAAIGISIYVFGISSIIGLISNNSLCCLFGAGGLLVLLFILALVRGIWFTPRD